MRRSRKAIPIPRFFFHVEGGPPGPADEGHELADVAAAYRDAVKTLGQMLIDDPQGLCAAGAWKIVVTTETGQTLFSVQASAGTSPVVDVTVVPIPAV